MSNKKSKLKLVVIILAVYLLVVSAASVIVDARHPEITLNGDETVKLEYGESFTDPGAEAHSKGRIFGTGKNKLKISVSGQVDTSKLGEYELEYTASVLGRKNSVKRKVTVQDTVPPEIVLKHSDGYKASWFTGYEEEGFTASDNVDGDITEKVQKSEEGNEIIYTVADSSGNTATARRSVEYSVTTPTISLNGQPDMYMDACMSYSEPGYIATDSLGNDMTGYVQVDGWVCPYLAGNYELHYSITNDRGDSASATRKVTVNPVAKPDVVKPEQKTIYLTFDDGPGPYTAQLLDVLAEYDVKVTFFVTACDTRYTDMIAREYKEGHSIGIHTYSHNYSEIYAGEDAYFADFTAMENVVYEQTGVHTRLFRFPGGSSNTVSNFNPGIMTRLANAMGDMGYKYFDWNVSSGDAGETKDTDQVFENVVDGCTGKTASIVLQHDIKDYSVNAVESIIQWGLANGYRFAALDMTSYEAHHGIAN